MKKIILSSLICIGTSFLGYAQGDIVIKVERTEINFEGPVATNDGTDYSSGLNTYTINTTTTAWYHYYITVYNNTSEDKVWRISRFNETNVPSTWSNYMCIGACFESTLNPYCSPNSVGGQLSLNAGAHGEFSFHLNVNADSFGTGNYKLFLADVNNCSDFEDSIEFQMNYTVGINELNQTPSFSMFPNPANDLVSIQLNNSKNGTVKIVDLVGNVIYSESISSSKTLNTSEFKNGIYFVTIESEGSKMTSRKLVVKH